jgi:OOP family OmpA-OmpF porin
VRIARCTTAFLVAAIALPVAVKAGDASRWLVTPRVAIWRTDAALAEAATFTPHLGAEFAWQCTPRTRLSLRGGWSHLEAARTGRDAELGTLCAGFAADLRGHGAVRPVAGLALGYAEDWTTDAPGALGHMMVAVDAGVRLAPGLRIGLEQVIFLGAGPALHGSFLHVGFQLPWTHRTNDRAEHMRPAAADDDGDGVANAADVCQHTPQGARVDARGCPLDADRDGIADAGDLCAATPAGARVDARGCPTDTDGDGVVDGLDRCPASPAGSRVDARGCARSALADALAGGRAILASLRFQPGTTDLLPGSESTLAELAAWLIASPRQHVEIAVFTSARGDAGRNRALSQQRADQLAAMVRARIPASAAPRVAARGYGEDEPFTGEDTAPSPWRSERVEIRVRAVAE